MNGNAEANYSLQNLKGKISFIPAVDKTLTKAGSPADAKETGRKISSIQFQIDNIDPSFAKNVGYDNANSGLSATDLQSVIDEITKCDYHEDIVIKGTPYGKGYYLEMHNMVIIHIVASTTSDITSGETFAELSKLSKNMQAIDNVGVIDPNGNGYGFRFVNKSIIAQSNIAQGTRLTFDVCVRIS